MTHNDILRRFRYALDISNATMLEIFRLSRHDMDQATLLDLLKKEDEENFRECSPQLLGLFLDGLITLKRGARQPATDTPQGQQLELTNNDILKKIRIALELREEDIIAIMRLANVAISRAELSALFRGRGQKNYKKCGDQFLRQFLQGLTIRFRGGAGGAE